MTTQRLGSWRAPIFEHFSEASAAAGRLTAVSHGGIALEEVMVPFVRISEAR
jgi:hypothetical protein